MGDGDWLARRFEEHRPHLRAVAYRMLGSVAEADDAVQEAWLRLNRTGADTIDNLGGWLTTVVGRVALDMLRSRKSRREEPLDVHLPDPIVGPPDRVDPEHQALLADSVGLALLVVLATLAPAERVAFVLHDMFGLPFDQIAPIVDRSTPATRQLASRARARVQRRDAAGETDRLRQAELVEAFLSAARGGDFEALLSVLDPEVVLRADEQAVSLGAPAEAQGREPVGAFSRVARGATRALVDGAPAAAWVVGGRPKVVYVFTTSGDHITAIELIADEERIERLDLVIAE
jgi:RNA polymerase sigma factor (sigma-70 family)